MTPPLHSRRSVLAAGSVLGVAALAGCTGFTGPTATSQSTTTVPRDGADRLVVENKNGDVVVAPDADLSEEVVVDVTKRVAGEGGLFGDVAVETTSGSGTLEIGTVYETVRARRVSVDLVLAVPPDLAVETASTANGDVEVSDLSGDATVESANGDAIARGVDGFVTVRSANGDAIATGCTGLAGASTANGNVEVEVRSLRGDVSISSGNGDVEVGVPSTLDAALVLSTANGNVSVRDVEVTVARSTDRRFEGTLGDGGDTITASSGNGDVELYALD
jgi:hypothetical protein